MSTDEQTAPPGPVADVCPLPDLGEVLLATLADHPDPRLAKRVEALLRHPETLDETWAGTPDPEPAPPQPPPPPPPPGIGFRSHPASGQPYDDGAGACRR
ncbi:hypothetical protein [Streptomyces sp. WMMC1477]|uniref:hypothetical protein n=1 Tax=Streptomyces sp. WMMC1477 TaxID=3015155 RepID=UPI0022B665A5|nr:hypothetical protein [Streptomyces sp. WMMC1477]MCZ7433609.1 hypothetical protein [Streptomyces sp. WMMC1477]